MANKKKRTAKKNHNLRRPEIADLNLLTYIHFFATLTLKKCQDRHFRSSLSSKLILESSKLQKNTKSIN